jgi:hypothetical protein
MILTLASAALIPSTRLFANGGFDRHGRLACDKKFAQMITDLEHLSWDISKTHDLEAAKELFADDFFEVIGTGDLSSRQELLDVIAAGVFTVHDGYQFFDDFVVRTTETSALINYRMIVTYDYYGEVYTDDLRATSSYAKIKGRWRCCSYHETYMPPV